MAKNIGMDAKGPKKACTGDAHCPFHGLVKIRGREHEGIVTSTKMRRSAVVSWEHRHFLPKYERYEKRFSKITVHAPDCLEVKEGDMVRIAETRPLSKTKHHVIIENLGQERGFRLKQALREEGKVGRKESKEETVKDAKPVDKEESQ